MMKDNWKLHIARLALSPGETLVVQSDKPLSATEAARCRDYLETCTPDGVRILFLQPGIALSVLAAAKSSEPPET